MENLGIAKCCFIHATPARNATLIMLFTGPAKKYPVHDAAGDSVTHGGLALYQAEGTCNVFCHIIFGPADKYT